MNAYTVEYKKYMHDQVHRISFLAKSKIDAYIKAVNDEIPSETGEHPYSAWVYSVTYQNGKHKLFNTHEGKPY